MTGWMLLRRWVFLCREVRYMRRISSGIGKIVLRRWVFLYRAVRYMRRISSVIGWIVLRRWVFLYRVIRGIRGIRGIIGLYRHGCYQTYKEVRIIILILRIKSKFTAYWKVVFIIWTFTFWSTGIIIFEIFVSFDHLISVEKNTIIMLLNLLNLLKLFNYKIMFFFSNHFLC